MNTKYKTTLNRKLLLYINMIVFVIIKLDQDWGDEFGIESAMPIVGLFTQVFGRWCCGC